MVASRLLSALSVLVVMLSSSALAAQAQTGEEVVATASRAAPVPTEAELTKAKETRAQPEVSKPQAAHDLTTQEQIALYHATSSKIDRAPSDYAQTDEGTSGPRQIHGEAGVTIGTGGYRSGYVTSYIPVGERGILGISVSQTDFGKNGGYVYDYGHGYGGYGYGGYGYGRRGGTSQSLGLSLDMTGRAASATDVPEGCVAAFRDGDRYVEPLWVSRMHADRKCEATLEP